MSNLLRSAPIWLLAALYAQNSAAALTTPSPTPAASPADTKQQLEQNQRDLKTKERELAELEKTINELEQQRDTAAAQAELAARKAVRLSHEVAAAQLVLQQTALGIADTAQAVRQTEQAIEEKTAAIEQTRRRLRETVRALYQYDQQSLLDIVLSAQTLAELMTEQSIYRELQQRAFTLIQTLREQQAELERKHQQLTERQQELQKLKEAQVYQQTQLTRQQQAQAQFKQLKTAEQAHYEQKAAEAREARAEIERDIFTLKGIGLEIALADAYSAARYAGALTGVRPALLLAVLKVETNVGERLGSGRFPDDMHPQSRDAFLRITTALGLDPLTSPISARPTVYAGWGGAMGPGQFMPATWETIESRTARLLGKPVANPYELLDALVGTGLILADRGATQADREIEATARYLAGPNWLYHTWYSQRVLSVAAEYEKEGL